MSNRDAAMSPVFLEALNMVQKTEASPARGGASGRSSTLAGETTTAADLAAAADAAPVPMDQGKADAEKAAVRPHATHAADDGGATGAAVTPVRAAARVAGAGGEGEQLPRTLSASGTGFVRRILEEEIDASCKRARVEVEQARAVQMDRFFVRGPASSPSQPSPKRAYGQVTRLSHDAWQTPDKRIFQRSYLAYRHLKHLKETNQLALFQQAAAHQVQINATMETCAHVTPFEGHTNAQTTVERTQDGAVTSFVLFGRAVNLDSLPDDPCPYHLLRLWSRNAKGKFSGVIVHRERPDTLPDLPPIEPAAAAEQPARPPPVSAVRSRDDALPIGSQPKASTTELLADVIELGARARKRSREHFAARLQRHERRVQYLNAVSEEYMQRARREAAEWMARQGAENASAAPEPTQPSGGGNVKQARRKVSLDDRVAV